MIKSKRMRRISLLAAGAIAALGTGAFAASLTRIAIIQIPGNKLEQFDIGYVDSETGRYYVTDRSNAAVNIFDTRKMTYVGRVTGFVGLKFNEDKRPNIQLSGPNGVAFDPGQKQLWAADGDSTVKVIDVAANPPKIIASISTGGQKRADELGIDTKDGMVLVGNNADKPSYVTFISTKPDHAILAKIEMPEASDGIDQPLYVPETGMFYASVPIWKEEKNHGGLAVFDPKTLKMTKQIPINDCVPFGLAQGPGTNVIVGCGAGSKARTPTVLTPATVIIDVATEKVVKVIHKLGGQDEVWYNPKGSPVLHRLARHSVRPGPGRDQCRHQHLRGKHPHRRERPFGRGQFEANGAIFVPLTAGHPDCPNGCIGVYQIK